MKATPNWHIITEHTEFEWIPKEDLFILIEHDPRVSWGNDDVTPFIRRAKLVKTTNPEYSWELLEYDEHFENKYVNQEYNVVAYRLLKN